MRVERDVAGIALFFAAGTAAGYWSGQIAGPASWTAGLVADGCLASVLALAAIASADLLVVGGTSLVVYPAAGLIRYFGGDTLVILNRDPTPQDSLANVLISCDIAEAFDF